MIEPSPGVYDWTQADAILASAGEHGFRTIVTIISNPSWAADTECGPIHEENLPDFANFLRATAQRYAGSPYNIQYWALYNEPDNSNTSEYFTEWLGGCWGGPVHPNALPDAGGAAYAHMLSYAYPAIKEGNPRAQVLLGGLAYDYFADEDGIFDPNFIDDLMAAGGGQYFDIINFHYYRAFRWRWHDADNNVYNRGITYKARYLQDELRRYMGGKTKPILCSEVGEGSVGKDGKDLSELQANYLVQSMVRGKYAGIVSTIWFEGVDEAWLPGIMNTMGLIEEDGTPKLSYRVYKTLMQELSGARFIRIRDDLDSRFEGYDFEVNGMIKTVLWSTEEGYTKVSLAVPNPGDTMRVMEKNGSYFDIADGSGLDMDGEVNGRVEAIASESPRYYEVPGSFYDEFLYQPLQMY